MKTFAGGKLWTRNPAAAPATIAAKTPAAARSRSKAITENATAPIAQTPAARPSIPSEKLTTFIRATSPITVSGTPTQPKSTAPANGRVMLLTFTPAETGMIAAAV
ncbi:unannotated protein [freshwater metagenome]|uniref:Unannotated protein n=1 Tax=freshwater metagenome TaxID=449393 RepID=A0A6J7D741_9ZZZZ